MQSRAGVAVAAGDVVTDKKSASTVMDKSFLGHSMHILDNDMTDRTNADHLIQEMALKDWMRGGGSRDEAHEKISIRRSRRSRSRSRSRGSRSRSRV
jgi:hypothetical protein